MENWISAFTAICVSLLIFGFILGFIRNWKKSLTRGIIVFICLTASLLLSPVLSSYFIDKYVDGTSIVAFGYSINFQQFITSLVGDETIANDILVANSTTGDLITVIINLVLNIVAFFVLFLAMVIISLIIYWIVILIISIRRRKNTIVTEKNGKYWGLKFVGGIIGVVSMGVFCFALLTPIFGLMNICDKFLEIQSTEQKADATTLNNFVAGKIYYTEDNTIGNIEGYIQTYAELREEYNSSFIGKVFNATGISKLGAKSFNYLTNVSSNNLNVNLTEEFTSIVGIYNKYKDIFIVGEFNLENNNCVDDAFELYNMAKKSTILESYINEILPLLCERWINDDAFLGINMPEVSEYKPVVKEFLKVFKNSNSTRVDANVEAIFGVVKVANNNDLIKNIREKNDLLSYLNNNKTLVNDVILKLSSTLELKQMMPNVVNELSEIAYNAVVGESITIENSNLTNEEIDNINWQNEAFNLQEITNSLASVYMATRETNDSIVMIDQLVNIGNIIDRTRDSILLSDPFKVFIQGYIQSDNFKLEEAKQPIQNAITNYWDNEEYNFVTMFSAIQEASKIAQNIENGDGEINLEELSNVLKLVLDNQEVKGTIKEVLQTNVVKDMVGENESSEVLNDMLNTFIDNTTSETLDKDIKAGQEIVNIINDSKNNDGSLLLSGETEEEKQQTAQEIIEIIADSDNIMSLIEDSNNQENSSLKNITTTLGGDANILIEGIDTANITQEQKDILYNLFGIA